MADKKSKMNLVVVWNKAINHPLLWNLITNHLNKQYCTTENIDCRICEEESKKIVSIPNSISYTNVSSSDSHNN